MKKQVYDYFLNLDNVNLIKEHNVILENQKAIKHFEYNSDIIGIGKDTFFTKYTGDLYETFQPIAASELFAHTGILTPPIFVTKENDSNSYSQIAQSVYLPQFSECCPAASVGEYLDLIRYSSESQDKWEVLHNPAIKEFFLEFMTDECFNEIISLFLVDELRSECDRHLNNYFLYKLPGSDKYNGIILIDHDNVYILNFVNAPSFKRFLTEKYSSSTPSVKNVVTSHKEGIIAIRRLLDEGVLAPDNISALKSALTFDMGQKIKDLGKKFGEDPRNTNIIYSPLSFLWEYNRNALKTDLEL